MTFHIRQIDPESRDAADWIRVPKIVHHDDPYFVIQPDKQERQRISKRHNPYLTIADAAFFIAYRGNNPIGRISAQYDERLRDDEGRVIGQFGFTDFVEDQNVATALVRKATEWLRAKGAHSMRGPFNLSINQECGCLIEGFDIAPAIMMPHAKPWTGKMLEAAGLTKAMDLLAYRVNPHAVPDRLLELARREQDAHAIVVRPIDTRNLKREFKLMGEIFNEGWRDNWGFLPFTAAELHHLADELKFVMKPDYGFFVEVSGRPVGVMMALPNINELIAPMRGRIGLWNYLKIAWQLYREEAKTARVLVLGLGKQFHGGATGAAIVVSMLEHLIARGRHFHLNWVEFSWILEDNKPALDILKRTEGHVSATYRIYGGSVFVSGKLEGARNHANSLEVTSKGPTMESLCGPAAVLGSEE